MGTEAGLPDDVDARAIAEGRHGDPFSVLGLHDYAGRWVLTAFMPDAARLIVVTPGGEYRAKAWPGVPGVFTCDLPGWSGYRLRAEGAGWFWEYDDPYAFGPVLGEIDEYLLGEGSHQRLWQALGGHLIPMRALRARISQSGRPRPNGSRLWAPSTPGTAAGM